MELLLEMTLEEVLKLFEGRLPPKILEVVRIRIRLQEEDILEKAFGATWELKMPLLLKVLSIIKKDLNQIEASTLESLIKLHKLFNIILNALYHLTFFLKYKNIQNNLNQQEKQWIAKFATINSYSELKIWLANFEVYKNNLKEVILEKIWGDKISGPIFENDEFLLYEPTNFVEARKIGGDTKWCISSPTSGKEYFTEYKARQYNLYALVSKHSDEKYLLGIKFPLQQSIVNVRKRYAEYFEDTIDIKKFSKEIKEILYTLRDIYGYDNSIQELKVLKNKPINDMVLLEIISKLQKKYQILDSPFMNHFPVNLIQEALQIYVKNEFNVDLAPFLDMISTTNIFSLLKKSDTLFEVFQHMMDEYFTDDQLMKNAKTKELVNFTKYIIDEDLFVEYLPQSELKDRNNDDITDWDELKTVFSKFAKASKADPLLKQYMPIVLDTLEAIEIIEKKAKALVYNSAANPKDRYNIASELYKEFNANYKEGIANELFKAIKDIIDSPILEYYILGEGNPFSPRAAKLLEKIFIEWFSNAPLSVLKNKQLALQAKIDKRFSSINKILIKAINAILAQRGDQK